MPNTTFSMHVDVVEVSKSFTLVKFAESGRGNMF